MGEQSAVPVAQDPAKPQEAAPATATPTLTLRDRIAESVKAKIAVKPGGQGETTETAPAKPAAGSEAAAAPPKEGESASTSTAAKEDAEGNAEADAKPDDAQVQYLTPEELAKLDFNSVPKEKVPPEYRKTWESMAKTWGNKLRGFDGQQKKLDAELKRVTELRETLERATSQATVTSAAPRGAAGTTSNEYGEIVDLINDPETFAEGVKRMLTTSVGRDVIGAVMKDHGVDPEEMKRTSRATGVQKAIDLVRNDEKIGKRFREFEADPDRSARLEEHIQNDDVALEMVRSGQSKLIARAIRGAFLEIEREIAEEERTQLSTEREQLKNERERLAKEKEKRNAQETRGTKAVESQRKGAAGMPEKRTVASVVHGLVQSGNFTLTPRSR